MTDQIDSDTARHNYAVDRSHKDAESSNSTARTTAQVSILINGGAATAVLAFLAKEQLDPLVLKAASICLGIYAIGVTAGATMMYCAVRALDFYSLRWRFTALPEEGASAENNRKLGYSWWRMMRRC